MFTCCRLKKFRTQNDSNNEDTMSLLVLKKFIQDTCVFRKVSAWRSTTSMANWIRVSFQSLCVHLSSSLATRVLFTGLYFFLRSIILAFPSLVSSTSLGVTWSTTSESTKFRYIIDPTSLFTAVSSHFSPLGRNLLSDVTF